MVDAKGLFSDVVQLIKTKKYLFCCSPLKAGGKRYDRLVLDEGGFQASQRLGSHDTVKVPDLFLTALVPGPLFMLL